MSKRVRLSVDFAVDDLNKLWAAVRKTQRYKFGRCLPLSTASEALYELFIMGSDVDTAAAGIRILWRNTAQEKISMPPAEDDSE